MTSGFKYLAFVAAGLTIAVPAWTGEPQQAEAKDGRSESPSRTEEYQRAEQELKQEKTQRILGVVPNFSTSFIQDAAPLSSGQKFRLALWGALDPFAFVGAGLDAGLEMAGDGFAGYGYGAQGYAKRFGAAYADSFSGSIFGGAIVPSLLHQDPRYFRKGTGSFRSRLFYSISTTVRTKNDNGHWAPNYSNILGNLAAGTLANLYYPRADRGVELTLERAFTVTAEGALGSIFVEFWPDISAKLFHKQKEPPVTNSPQSSPTNSRPHAGADP